MKYIKKLQTAIRNRASESSRLMPIFGIFGIINYPAFHIIWSLIAHNDFQYLNMRLFAAILCFGLIFKDYKPIKNIIPLYWYLTVIYCLPFFCAYMFLINHGSSASMLNVVLATFMLIMIVDWLSFAITMVIGIILAIIYYKVTVGMIFVETTELINTLINMSWVVLVCIFFSYSKDAQTKSRKLHLKQINIINQALEQKVLERTIDLEKSLAIKTEFLNNMSHEIRTPMQGFTSISEGLVEHWKSFDDEKKFKLAGQVAKSAKRLTILLNNILDLSKLNNKKMIMDFQEVDLNKITEDIIEECNEMYLNDKSIDIIFKHSEYAYMVADAEKISQVLRNLFVNAIKFSNNGSKIVVTITNTDNELHFTITDEGVGIPENELEDIFGAFTQSSYTKTGAGGTGLGLSICKEIIEAHHGKIWATNNKKHGSSLHFIIAKNHSP